METITLQNTVQTLIQEEFAPTNGGTRINKSVLAISNFKLEINRGFLITGVILEELSVGDRGSGAKPQLLAIVQSCALALQF